MTFLPPVPGYYRLRTSGRGWFYDQNETIQPHNPSYGFPAVNSINTETVKGIYDVFYDAVRRQYKGRGVSTAFHFHGDFGGVSDDNPQIWEFSEPIGFRHSHPMTLRFEDVASMRPNIPQSVQESLKLEAFDYFSDVFPELLSFSEFLFGITKLKDLLPEIGDSIGKTISGGYLNEKFGWENLLSDLEHLRTVIKDVQERLAYLRRIRGRGTRMHFRRVLSSAHLDLDSFQEKTPAGVYVHRGFSTRYSPISYKVEFSATSWLYETLDYIDGVVGLLRGMMGAFGLNNPIKAIWVNIPFSFVVDWFIHVDKHLDKLTRLNPVGGWELSNITHTFRFDVRVKVEVYRNDLNSYPGKLYEDRGSYQASWYDRRVGLPVGLESLTPGLLSPNQLTLLLAILHQLS